MFSFSVKRLMLCLGFLATLAACSKDKSSPEDGNPNLIDTQKIRGSFKPPAEKAELLALAGERIMYTPSFILADPIFDMALEQDSKNVRARFYKSTLAIAMAGRGILKRIEPLMAQLDAKTQKQYHEMIQDYPAGDVRDFLLNGNADIKDAKDAQNFLRSVQDVARETRKTYVALEDQKLTAHTVLKSSQPSGGSAVSKCGARKVREGVYEVIPCPGDFPFDLKLDWADWKAVELGLASYSTFLGLYSTTYDATGIERVLQKLPENSTAAEAVAIMKTESQLGRLVDDKSMKEALQLGAEGLEALKYAMAHQAELCQKGLPDYNNRPGYVFSSGICVDEKTRSLLPTLELALRGPVEWVFEGPRQKTYKTTVNVKTVLEGSIGDLKSQLPDKFNSCGDAEGVADATMGGLFPNGDALKVFSLGDSPTSKPVCPRQ